MIDMKEKIINLVKEHHYLNIAEIAHELYITVSEAKKHAKLALDEKILKFDEKTLSYHYNFDPKEVIAENDEFVSNHIERQYDDLSSK